MGRHPSAFTRIELVLAVAALALLGALALPLFAGTRAGSDHASCFSNLRQLGVAALAYADDHEDHFPARRLPAWPQQLSNYYRHTAVLRCPSDGPDPASSGPGTNADGAPRSYLMNGWNDYYAGVGTNGAALPTSAILEPMQTIVLGEKQTTSSHFWMDYWSGDDYQSVEQRRHYSAGVTGTDGASNHTFADGSVRLLKFGEGFSPVNLWFVQPEWRTCCGGL